MADYIKHTKGVINPTNSGNTTISIDMDVLASKISRELSKDLSKVIANLSVTSVSDKQDDFDNKNSLSSLANTMTVQRGNKSSNFDNLGEVKISTKDQGKIDSTLDLLKGLD